MPDCDRSSASVLSMRGSVHPWGLLFLATPGAPDHLRGTHNRLLPPQLQLRTLPSSRMPSVESCPPTTAATNVAAYMLAISLANVQMDSRTLQPTVVLFRTKLQSPRLTVMLRLSCPHPRCHCPVFSPKRMTRMWKFHTCPSSLHYKWPALCGIVCSMGPPSNNQCPHKP